MQAPRPKVKYGSGFLANRGSALHRQTKEVHQRKAIKAEQIEALRRSVAERGQKPNE